MVVENTGDGRRSDQPYLVFARMAELSDRSINIRHEEKFQNILNPQSVSNCSIRRDTKYKTRGEKTAHKQSVPIELNKIAAANHKGHHKKRSSLLNSGGRIRTCDLRVMGLTTHIFITFYFIGGYDLTCCHAGT
jgi:hypothetical protein